MRQWFQWFQTTRTTARREPARPGKRRPSPLEPIEAAQDQHGFILEAHGAWHHEWPWQHARGFGIRTRFPITFETNEAGSQLHLQHHEDQSTMRKALGQWPVRTKPIPRRTFWCHRWQRKLRQQWQSLVRQWLFRFKAWCPNFVRRLILLRLHVRRTLLWLRPWKILGTAANATTMSTALAWARRLAPVCCSWTSSNVLQSSVGWAFHAPGCHLCKTSLKGQLLNGETSRKGCLLTSSVPMKLPIRTLLGNGQQEQSKVAGVVESNVSSERQRPLASQSTGPFRFHGCAYGLTFNIVQWHPHFERMDCADDQ